MKKYLALGLAAVLSLTVFAGCAPEDDGGENEAPVISGVQPTATVHVDEEFDALKGVTASDKEDGDLTSKIEVSSEDLTFTNGKTTPKKADDQLGFEIIYTVKDSDGEETNEYCTLYVLPAVGELQNKYTADFSAVTGEGDMHYWDFNVANDAAATKSFEKGALAVNVTTPGGGEDKITLAREFDKLTAGTYTVAFWLYASAPIKTTIRTLWAPKGAEKPSDWDTHTWDKESLAAGQDGYGKEVGTKLTRISHTFDLTEQQAGTGEGTNVNFRLGLGGGYDNTQPATYKVYVEKVAIWKESGTEEKTPIVEHTFKNGHEGLFSDEATMTDGENGTKLAITYPTETDDAWRIKVSIGLGEEVSLTKGEKYYYSFKIKAQNAITGGEVCVEQSDTNDAYKNRASFDNITLDAGEEKEFSVTFTMGAGQQVQSTLSDAVCRLYLGKHESAVTSNEITISDFHFGSVTGNKNVDRVSIDKFTLLGDRKVDVFNGSDESLNNKGIGTAYYAKNGNVNSLVYLVHEGDTDDQGKNKIVVSPVDLAANAYYVISITVKASAAIDMNVCLHDINRAWGSSDEGVLLRAKETLSGEYKTFTFETSDYSLIACKCELLLEFGSAGLADATKNGDVTVEFSDIKIGVKEIRA